VVKRAGRGVIPPLLNTPSWRGAQLKERHNFIFTSLHFTRKKCLEIFRSPYCILISEMPYNSASTVDYRHQWREPWTLFRHLFSLCFVSGRFPRLLLQQRFPRRSLYHYYILCYSISPLSLPFPSFYSVCYYFHITQFFPLRIPYIYTQFFAVSDILRGYMIVVVQDTKRYIYRF